MQKMYLKAWETNMVKSKYSLKMVPKAAEDLDGTYSYISKKLYVERAADNLLDRIETSIMKLQTFL